MLSRLTVNDEREVAVVKSRARHRDAPLVETIIDS